MDLAASEVEAAVRREKLVAVLRLRDHRRVVEVAATLAEHGVKVLEITLDHPDAVGSLARVANVLRDDVVLGAGTVLEPDQVMAARDAGARFCVSPHTDPQLITAVLAGGLAPVPGVLTPTELVLARRSGARLLKVFPSGAQGTGHLRALLGPFGDAELIPTGGIGIDDIPTWLGAGAAAVGLGSSLVDRDGTLDGLADRARRAVAAVAAAADQDTDGQGRKPQARRAQRRRTQTPKRPASKGQAPATRARKDPERGDRTREGPGDRAPGDGARERGDDQDGAQEDSE